MTTQTFETWGEAAHDAAAYIHMLSRMPRANGPIAPAAPSNPYDTELNEMLERLDLAVDSHGDDSHALVLCAAANALRIIVQTSSVTAADIADICTAKQRDYGVGNILRFGHQGIKVRLSDKAERIKNMVKKAGPNWPATLCDGAAEPLMDAFIDIVGYAIITDMLVAGDFELPLDPPKPWYENVAWIQREKSVPSDTAYNPPHIVIEGTDTANQHFHHKWVEAAERYTP